MTNEKQKNKNSCQGQSSRSNVTNFLPLQVFSMGHIPTKLHRFSTSGFRDFAQADTQTLPKTIPARSVRADN